MFIYEPLHYNNVEHSIEKIKLNKAMNNQKLICNAYINVYFFIIYRSIQN